MTQGLPLGNGRLGGLVPGKVAGESIALDESSLWAGTANLSGGYDSGPTGAFGGFQLFGNLLSFAKDSVAVTNGDVTYAIEISDDLGLTNPWHSGTPPTDNATTISYQLPVGKPKDFARLVVTQTP